MATGVNVGNAYINVRADSKYIKGDMAKAQTAFTTSFKRIALAATAAATAATYALSKIGKEAISVAAKYESALVDMGKVTNQSFDVIKKAVESIDPVLGTSTELMKGYYQVISAGVTEPKEALETLTTASKLAKTAHIDQAEAIKGITKIMAGYGDELKTTSEAADLLFAIEKEGQTSVAELIPIIGGLAVISAEAGVSSDELGASLATVSKVLGSTSEAGTAYKAIISGLQRGSAELITAWEKLGVSGYKAAIQTWGFAETLVKLKEYSNSSGIEMVKLLGAIEGATGALAIAADGASAFNASMDTFRNKTGLAEAAFKRWTETTEAFVQVWKSVKEKVLVIIGDALIPVLKDVITQMAEWVKANEDLIKQKVPEYIDKVATSIKGIIGIYNSIPAGVTGAAFGGIIGRILTGSTPIGLAVGALILLNEQLAKIGVGNWGSIGESFQDLSEIIDATIAGERWEGLAGNVNKVTMKIIDTRDVTDSWLEKIKALPEATKEVIKGFDDLGEKSTKVIETVSGGYAQMYREIAVYNKKLMDDWIRNVETATAEGFLSMISLGEDYKSRFMQMERGLVDIHGKAMADVLRGTKTNYSDLEDLQDSWLKKTKNAWNISAEDIMKSEKEVTEFIKEQYDERYAKGEWFFGGLQEWLWDNVRDWEGWGREIALSAYDMFDQIASDFESTVASGLKGEFDSIGDFWDAMLDNMLDAFADFVADLITKWALTELAGLFDIDIGISGGGDSIATSILGKIASYVGEALGLTGEGGILTAAYDYVASLFAEEGGAAIWSEAATLPGYGAGGIGGEMTAAEAALIYEPTPAATSGLVGAGIGSAWATGGVGFAPGAASITEAGLAGATGGYTGAGTGVLGGIAGFAAMAIMGAINIEDMRKRRSALFDLKQQFDDYYATLESSDQAAATFSESQASMFELVGDASTGYFLAQAVSLKASAGEYEELAKIHGESVEAVTARYENLGEAMKDFGYHVDEFGRIATSLEAGELIQEALWGTETAVSEANILKLTLEWDVGNLDEISAAALKTTNDLKTITEGPSATMDMDEYYDAAVASAERYIDNMKSKMQDLSTSEQDYVTAMLEVWTDSTNSRTAMSQTFFDSAEESYRALTETEQAWVLTALSDYESLTTEGTAAAQSFYESQVASYDMLSEAEQAWAASALGVITEYYEGATALSSSFLEKYRGDYETSLSVINEYADNSLSTIKEYIGSLYPELAEFYETGTGYFESATTAAEDAINDLVETGISAAEGMADTITNSTETTLTSITDSFESAGVSWDTFTTKVDAWTPESKVVDILYKYSSESGDIPGFQHGGIASGPTSGYPVILHGTERITPLSDGGSDRSGGSGPLNLNLVLELDGKTLEYKIKSISDDVNVNRERRNVLSGRSLY